MAQITISKAQKTQTCSLCGEVIARGSLYGRAMSPVLRVACLGCSGRRSLAETDSLKRRCYLHREEAALRLRSVETADDLVRLIDPSVGRIDGGTLGSDDIAAGGDIPVTVRDEFDKDYEDMVSRLDDLDDYTPAAVHFSGCADVLSDWGSSLGAAYESMFHETGPLGAFFRKERVPRTSFVEARASLLAVLGSLADFPERRVKC
jgi:hypothetical protein